MTEEEFLALLTVEGKIIVVDVSMTRGNYKNLYMPVPRYNAAVCDKNTRTVSGYIIGERSRHTAIQKLIKEYYANN